MTGQVTGTLREVEGSAQQRGLVIYRASRLEALLGPLQQLLAATVPDNVLAPQTIIAAHPGMRQWLYGALARAYGPHGIAANLDILLPSVWIERLARQRLGHQAVALPHYQHQHLRWSIHTMLCGDIGAFGITDARIVTYLQEQNATDDRERSADQARRRFQLADQLARIYSQYLVYRPDWLRAWEQGHWVFAVGDGSDDGAAATERTLLAPLWQHLRTRLGPHRGDVVTELIASLQGVVEPTSSAVLHVFGLSHLAPSELAVLRALARQQLVALYVPDPCRQYWGGLSRELPALRQCRRDELARIDAAHGNDYWADQSHPLLANWGRMGQHFIMALVDGEGDVLEDVRHWRDEQSARPRHRLGRVQQSIRELDPALMAVDISTTAGVTMERKDASLRIHACHTRLRELEVLRDQLLEALATPDAGGEPIKPSDIVVMAADIQAYVALIPSVFGGPGDSRECLPYHLADIAVARCHTLFEAFRRLLDLPASRITAPEVMDLLAMPEVARRQGLDQAGVDELSEWLKQSRVAWALDAVFRQRFGVPPIAEHTFGWAMDRMLAGYIMADASSDDRQSSVTLAEGCELLPLIAIHGPAARYLGALNQLLEGIQAICDLAGQSLPARVWAEELEKHFEALLQIDPSDKNAREARSMLLGCIRSIANEPGAVGENPRLHFAVVRDLLMERLSAVPDQQRLLMGGITFCGMVPQRAIPFKVVAVLGLNDGEFPRPNRDSGLDLMAHHYRLGDRDVRSDDRYLFLETLMSARQRLHLSYIGAGVRDGKPRNPAPPLAELLEALDAAADLRADDQQTDRPWWVHHPLQPFDPRYFNATDARLFSYSAHFAAMHGQGVKPSVEPFLDLEKVHPVTIQQPVTLRELHAYYQDPARQVLRQRLQVSLEALDDARLPQSEPIEPKFEALDSVAKKLLFNDVLPKLSGAIWSPQQAPAWLRLGGLLPPGRPGETAWQTELAVVNLLLQQLRRIPGLEYGTFSASNHEVDLFIAGQHLTGQVQKIYVTVVDGREQWQLLRAFSGQGGKLKTEKSLSFRDRVPLFLDWAVLRLQTAQAVTALLPGIRLRALVDDKDQRWQDGINGWDEHFVMADRKRQSMLLGELEQRLTELLDWWIEAQSTPSWYFPKSAWETIKDTVYSKAVMATKPDGSEPSAVAEQPLIGIGSVWIAHHQGGVGERDYAPGYNQLLAGDVDFAEGSSELLALNTFATRLNRCITLEAKAEVMT